MLEKLQSRKFILALLAAAAFFVQGDTNAALAVILAYLGIEGVLDHRSAGAPSITFEREDGGTDGGEPEGGHLLVDGFPEDWYDDEEIDVTPRAVGFVGGSTQDRGSSVRPTLA